MCAASPKRIVSLLSPGPGLLGSIINQIQLIQQLSRALDSQLPAALRLHCRLAAVNQRTLVVHADSAAWATRLRYLAPGIAASLREQAGYPWVRDIAVKVRPPAELHRGSAGGPAPSRGPAVEAAGIAPGGASAVGADPRGGSDAMHGPSA